jgi:hypothetical protein
MPSIITGRVGHFSVTPRFPAAAPTIVATAAVNWSSITMERKLHHVAVYLL